MDATFLRNLGVNEAIIQALQKSYGDEYEELEIMLDKQDLKLLLKRNGHSNGKPQILTLPGFFKMHFLSHQIETDIVAAIHYNCRDTLEFLSAHNSLKENLRINGTDMWLSDSLLRLLRYLAEKVIDTKSGWVYIQDMKTDGVIPSDGYQSFSRLRSAMAGYLLNRNGRDFIEANGRKQYRLSVDPKNIRLLKG